MERRKTVWNFFLGLTILGGTGWFIFWLIQSVLDSLVSLDPNVVAALVAGSATILASTVAVVLTRYFQAKKERESVHRDRKIELYDEFLAKLFEVFLDPGSDDKAEELTPFFREIQRKLILWSGPSVVKAYAEWQKVLTTSKPGAPHMIKMIDFFLALREDLGHSNKGLEHEHMIRFLLRNSDLFLSEYAKNPNVSLEEIATLEEKLRADKPAK